jgi:hypothetical protein
MSAPPRLRNLWPDGRRNPYRRGGNEREGMLATARRFLVLLEWNVPQQETSFVA